MNTALLRLFASTAHEIVIGMTADGKIAEWNREAERVLGWRADEALNQPLADIVIPLRLRDAHHHGMAHYSQVRNIGNILPVHQSDSA
jgi:PAS domain S-box-containing protein